MTFSQRNFCARKHFSFHRPKKQLRTQDNKQGSNKQTAVQSQHEQKADQSQHEISVQS